MSAYLYVPGSGIEVPGIEAIFEYGDVSKAKDDWIPGALRINDQSTPTRVRVNQIDGLQDDPDGRDSRQALADRHGENAGLLLYGGRTVGLTGRVEAGNIRAMRDKWSRLRSTFGAGERNLVVHTVDNISTYTNLVRNPSFRYNADWWSVVSTATVTGPTGAVSETPVTVGQVQYVSAGADTSLLNSAGGPWSGEDVYVLARVRIKTLTSGTISTLSVGVAWTSAGGSVGSSNFVDQASPVTGTWYELAIRVPAASALSRESVLAGISIKTVTVGAANFVVQVDDAMLVLLDPTDATPAGYLDGDAHNFGWTGKPHASFSKGPIYAENKIPDPEIRDVDASGFTLAWSAETNTGITLTNAAGALSLYAAGTIGRSVYFKQQKDLNATSRDMAIRCKDLDLPAGSGGQTKVQAGRSYRFTATITNVFKPATGSLVASLRWLLAGNTNTAEVNGTALATTSGVVTITATAPANAVGVMPLVRVVGTTTSGAIWEFYLTDPCMLDVSDYDPGDFYGVGDDSDEVSASVAAQARSRARRRVPRPFVLDEVRKTSDAKAPEQQRNTRYVRDFTMSLRAADPRIYVMDDRVAGLRLGSTSNLVSRQAPSDFTLESGSLGVPTGWTYEGNFVTHPGAGSAFNWSQEVTLPTTSFAKLPNSGVGIKTWNSSGVQGNNRPSSDLSTRAYRSAESYTYTYPRVIMGCSPVSVGLNASGYEDGSMNSILDSGSIFNSTATILLKRVSSTVWLELRWTSSSNAYSQAQGASAGTVYAFELWCSHNGSGTLTTSRLSAWDYTSYDSSIGKLPFLPSREPMYLVSYLSNNGANDIVNWELWRGYPSLINTTNRVETGTYSMAAGLAAVVGGSAAGQTGMALTMERGNSQANWNTLSARPPFVHYWESYSDSVPPPAVSCPVIGSVDTPQQIVLNGVTNPIISVEVPEFEDRPQKTSVAKLSGTIPSTVPVTIDLKKGTITDSTGANRYDMLLPGSSLESFRPGTNFVTIRATSWLSTVPNHLYAKWRDALR